MTKARNCPDDELSKLLALAGQEAKRAAHGLDGLLHDYPQDARLFFLKGSLQAAQQDFAAARASLRHAVDLAPDYAAARFQLGLLLLTSGEPHAAREAWGPLHSLPADNYLRLFVMGLCRLIQDEFDDTVRLLEQGMAGNHENPAVNHDMQMIVDAVRGRARSGDDGAAPASSVDFLLHQAALKYKLH